MTVKVLVMDDEDTVQSILGAFLNRYFKNKGETPEIKSLGDPVQGLFELTTNGDAYGLVLLDVRIPKLSGDEIYNSLEHVNPAVLDRVVFVTGYPEDLHERFPGRKLNILQKPFRFDSFAACLDKVLTQGASPAPGA